MADTPSSSSSPPDDAPQWLAVCRGVSLFLGAFCLLNVGGELLRPGFDANMFWIDLSPLPAELARGFLALAGLLMLQFAIVPSSNRLVQFVLRATVLVLLGTALWNTWVFFELLNRGLIRSEFPVPFSLQVVAALLAILAGVVHPGATQPLARGGIPTIYVTFAVCSVAFPIAQMYCFGKTDYRQPADWIVVFGCRVYHDGSPSPALEQRVLTAVELYQQGLAPAIVMSGGPGDGATDEPSAMRRLAVEQGVPEAAIFVDGAGLNTSATLRNLHARLENSEERRVLAVSDFFHLPRIKLSSRRQGLKVRTVPAGTGRFPGMWAQLARETAALWLYYLRPGDLQSNDLR